MSDTHDKHLVSVIIPTYNRAALIGRAIESAMGQTYPHKQIIVVDDGSVDNTAAVVRAYPGVQYVYRPNGGQAAARSTGLTVATGGFIASLDSDDVWEPGFLATGIQAMNELQLDFVFVNWYQQMPNGRLADYFAEFKYLRSYWTTRNESPMLFTYPELRRLYLECCPSPSSSVLIRRSSFVGAWNDRVHVADDWCLMLDIVLSKKARGAMIREKLWHKSVNDDNIYDGRDQYDVLRMLYIEDTREMLRRYAGQLTKEEVGILQDRCIDHSFQLLKVSFMIKAHYAGSLGKLTQAFWLNPVLFVKTGWKKLLK
ncbi:glycosyltransferase family 2 protein [Puia sp.]|jgi:glycosyltransferase involved in cell wall biosynthesis|uniref:glycosyltransferase family 2 protein n=1 Tax=Puia sp. TaxID=2045100 RepID=UPI002F409F84